MGNANVNSLVHAALNGARSPAEHPGIPRTPEQLALSARGAVDAGAVTLHIHVFNGEGRPTLEPHPCADALRAVRNSCPAVPISFTTVEGIAPDPTTRLDLVAAWTLLPDLVTANMGEAGILDLCELLMSRRVGIEAGLLSVADAEAFVRAGIAGRCTRVLVEPLDARPDDAIAHAEAMEAVVTAAGIDLEQVHHGDGIASWAVTSRAARRGHGIRTGLEDTTVMPDGTPAKDNADLVSAAMKIVRDQ
jgi:uncharacterized protein (DUF849 family)